VDYGGGVVMGASASQFKDMVGDILISEEFSGQLWHIHWDGVNFQKTLLARVAQWEHTAFGPAGIVEVGPSTTDVLLAGTATDDGRPPGSMLTVTWSVVSGPGPVRFADSHALSTTATFGDPGTYVLRLTATDGTLSTSDDMTVVIRRITPLNTPPVADAGPDQTVTIPESPVLAGSASDDGLPSGSAISLSWTQLSGPAPALFGNSNAGLTSVLFVVAGTYVFQLDASDGELTGSDTVTITVNPEPAILGGTLLLTASDPGPMPLGAAEFITATLLDASATPVPNFPIKFTVTGANPGTTTFFTDATGLAILPYTGRYPGVDSIFATATGFSQSLDSNTVSVTWLDIPIGTPLLTQGWIKSPIHQSTIVERVPVMLSDQITLASGTLRYWPYSHPDQVRTLATGVSAGPGETLATFDTTVLSNGSYVIDLSGTDNTGRQRQSEVLVVVDGEYKPGRVVVEVNDFTLPLAGLPITIGRRYDSLEKDNVGDFGHGWSLMIGHPKLEKDLANNVSITMPNGRRTTFYFTGNFPVLNGGPVAIVIGFLIFASYTPAPGTFGTLTSDGCPVMMLNPFNEDPPVCFPALSPSELLYSPTQYTYTDPQGTVYVMGAAGELRSITDRSGNSLTFTRNGIFSSTGKNVTFVRDAQGRITNVDYQPYFAGQDNAARYQYDGAGDLVTVDLAKVPFVFFRTMHHTYYASHHLKSSIDANGNTVRISTYDADGRLETDTDALGNVTRYTYDLPTRTHTTTFPDTGVVAEAFDPNGLLLRHTDQRGNTTTHEYNPTHNETRGVNALGEVTTATYDPYGGLRTRTDPTGTVTLDYDNQNRITAITDRLNQTTTFERDQGGKLSRVAHADGTRLKYTNSELGLPLTIEDAEGRIARLEYDAAGNVTKKTDWLGRVTGATYDEAGHRLTAISARGGTTTNTYYLSGNLAFTRDPGGYERTFQYDPNGNLVLEYDNAGRQTNSTYNALNQLTQQIHYPEGAVVSYTRDFRGNPLTMTDESGHTTRYEYDFAGNLTKTTFADGTFTTRTYDALNRLTSLTDERNNTTAYEYQAGCGCSDRVTKVTDPLGRATVTTYDANGRKSSVTDANGKTTSYAYDIRGQLIETSFPDGKSTHDGYDARGGRTSTTDQTGAATLYGYDSQGQITSITDPLGNVTRYGYDADGNITSLTDANGHATSYEYDVMKRKTKRTLPLGQLETFAYDLAGRPIRHTDFRGKTTTMTYDSRDRMLTKVPDPSLGEVPHTYTYSPTGMRLSSTDASGTTTYTYDLRDRRLTKAAPAGTLTYSYDPSGNVASVRSSNTNGTSIDYAWDAANQLTSITDNRVGGTTTATYTATRRPLTVVQPNGVGASYSYDSMDRVTSMLWQQGASPAFGSWEYTYNERGQRRTATDITGRSVEYAYDAAARLMRETISGDATPSSNGAITYALDAFANRLSRISGVSAVPSASYSYDANDQLTTDGHDANGNTTSSAGHTYAYDFENRLVSKDGGAVSFQYNCDGDRVVKTVGGVTTQYLVDDLNPTGYVQVLEEVVGGTVETRYTYGTRVLSQTRSVSTTPVTSYYGSDAHGNVTFLTNAGGVVTDSYDYDAWGILVGRTGSTTNTRLYAGEEFDPDLGLINLRARRYSPSTGRFFTLDPLDLATSAGPRNRNWDRAISSVINPHLRSTLEIAFPDRSLLDNRISNAINWNHFLYANSDPVNRIDPTGRNEILEEYALYLAITLAWTNVAIHLIQHQTASVNDESHHHAVFCAAVLDVSDIIVILMGLNPFISLGIAVLNLLCTLLAEWQLLE
jgi:RHS repeat-associated protein